MKRFSEYELSTEEISMMFGSQKSYELELKLFIGDQVCSDSEKRDIAYLLFLRGERGESTKMIDTIKDDGYRRSCLEEYASWDGAERGALVN